MARGFQFDTFDQAKIDARREQPAQGKPKHQPHVFECCECGDTIGPHWGEYGEFFCRRHVPDHLRHPGANR